ncbi:hypothetical protein KAU45_10300, partial [bacterium]|nr:hypothetical protein [bacterium]
KGFLELNLGTPLGDVVNLICGGGSEGPILEAVIGGSGAVPAAKFDSILDLPDSEPLPGPPSLGAPSLIHFRLTSGTPKEKPVATEETAEAALSPLTTLLARYGGITPPAGLLTSVLLGWRMLGQRLHILVQGAGDGAEFVYAGRLAQHLSRETPPEMARWASNLVNTLHSQS